MNGLEKVKKVSGKHISTIKGLIALLFGIALVYIARSVIINIIVFSCGLLLMYYSLGELKLQKIRAYIDQMVIKILGR